MGKGKKKDTFSTGLENTLNARIIIRGGKVNTSNTNKNLTIAKQVQRKMLKK
jgi:hypothetical protein